ncbi:FK506-binding protein 15 isoform 2-T2 [Pholidichthys leucotaenia]
MFGGDDEDGDFLSPTGGAKLASLFGLDQEASQGNESFQYTAPKQPRKTSNLGKKRFRFQIPPPSLFSRSLSHFPITAPANQKQAAPPGAPAVLFATAVQAFKYINGQYVKQGKLGAAVLGNHPAKEYKLLLYLSQQKQATAAKIHVGFILTVQPNNYCTFYDDQRQNWSLMFESEKSAADFCKEVCLAKANSSASLDSAVVQDLSLGEGQAVETGDSLEVVYTGWLLQNHAFGQIFDSNQNKEKLLRMKIGAGKVIKGWEEGMLGMKKSGRRLMIIPPHLAYGSKGVPNRIPANSTLIFEAELRRVKFSKDNGSDRTSSGSRDSAAPSPAPSVENLAPELPALTSASGPGRPGEPPLRAKSNSLSEQLANPDATKAKLISRMAKMGQPMLPFVTGVSAQPESSDSELEDTSGGRVKERPAAPSPLPITTTAAPAPPSHPHPHPLTAPTSALLPVMTTVGPQVGSHAFQPYAYTQTTATAPSPLQPAGQAFTTHTVPYVGTGDVTSFLMTEARQHNTEIRLAVGKVADKVDHLASKIDDLQKQGAAPVGVSAMSMETSMIVHNIQRIVQENECLKKEVFEKSARIEEQNRKIGDLINQNQRYMEQSHQLLEQRNDSLKSSSEQNTARLLQAEQDKVRLTEDLAAAAARVSQLQLEASAQQQKAAELQSKLNSALQDGESQRQRNTAVETQLGELKEAADRAQTRYQSEKQKRKEVELRVTTIEEELQDLRTDKERLEQTLSERKKKWQVERQRRDEEVEELRRNNQQELDNLRVQLRKARTSSNNAASEQLSQLQAELEEEWKKKCKQMLVLEKEQHSRELTEVTEQRDALQDRFTQLQDKFTALKQSRESEEATQLQHSRVSKELQNLQEKYSALEQQGAAVREKFQKRVDELERNLEEQQGSGDTVAEVKRVMNGVFHSLRAEFELGESYSGQAVLAVIMSTIKNVTLQLLSGSDRTSLRSIKKENEEEERGGEDMNQREEASPQNVHLNGDGEVKEEEEEEEEETPDQSEASITSGPADHKPQQPAMMETETPDQSGTDVLPESTNELKAQEAAMETPDQSETDVLPQSISDHKARDETAMEMSDQSETSVSPGPTDQTSAEESETLMTPELHQQQQQEPPFAPEPPAEEEKDPKNSEELSVSEEAAVVSSEDGEHVGEEDINTMSENTFGPPTNPPPPPREVQQDSEQDKSLTGRTGEENGEEPFFQNPTPTKPPAAPSEEDEEDEMNLKGRPPPAPLFGDDDDDDDDLDWLN